MHKISEQLVQKILCQTLVNVCLPITENLLQLSTMKLILKPTVSTNSVYAKNNQQIC